MDIWKNRVKQRHGDTAESLRFISHIERHISGYQATKLAYSQGADPVDNYEALTAITKAAKELSALLGNADHRVSSFIKQGLALNQLPLDQFESLEEQLKNIAIAGSWVLDEIKDDEDIQRRGWWKKKPAMALVLHIRQTYTECFNEPADADNKTFRQILEPILDSVGISNAKLTRTIEESNPPK